MLRQQDSNTSDMIFRVEEIVSWASRDATLLPGTVIMTGTAEGIGAARDPPVYMAPVSSNHNITFLAGNVGVHAVWFLRVALKLRLQRSAKFLARGFVKFVPALA